MYRYSKKNCFNYIVFVKKFKGYYLSANKINNVLLHMDQLRYKTRNILLLEEDL